MKFAARLTIALAASLTLLAGASADDSPKLIRIGLLPGEAALTVLRQNEPLRAELERRIGVKVELIVGIDYAATGEAIRFGRIDIAYLGPVTYVLQRQHAVLEPFATPSHKGQGATFRAAVIAQSGGVVKSLADLRGKDVAFGDIASTSGHWLPRLMILRDGLVAEKDYKPHFLGAHDAVAYAVTNGKAAAGGISKPIYERLANEKKINREKLRIIAESPPIPEYAWTFRQGLDQEFKKRVAEAFLSLSDPDTLRVFAAERFVVVEDRDYDVVRDWVQDVRGAPVGRKP